MSPPGGGEDLGDRFEIEAPTGRCESARNQEPVRDADDDDQGHELSEGDLETTERA